MSLFIFTLCTVAISNVCYRSNKCVLSSTVPLVSVAAVSECFLSTAVVSSFWIATRVLRNHKHLPRKMRFHKTEYQRFGPPIPKPLFGNRTFDYLVMWFKLLSPVTTKRGQSRWNITKTSLWQGTTACKASLIS